MNDMVTIETGTALAIIPKAQLPTLLAADSGDILGKLFAELDGWEKDTSTVKGRAEIRSKIHKARIARADFQRIADALKEGALKTQRAVNAESKIMDGCFESLIATIGAELREIEAAEAALRKANEDAIAAMEMLVEGISDMASEQITARLDSIQPFNWAIEFRTKGERVKAGVIAQLQVAHQTAVRREATALAEAERLAEQAERDRLAAIEAQRIREEQIAAEAAARATREAEEKAQAALQAAEALRVHQAGEAERKARAAAEALAKAEADRLAGIERERVAAEKAETERVEAHKRALASIKGMISDACSPFNGSDMIRHITKVMDGMREMTRDWEEFADEAPTVIAEGRKRIADRLAVVEGHEAARREQLRHEEKLAAEQKAEAAQTAAIEAERQRVARGAETLRFADEKRAANVAHRTRINREILADLIAAINDNQGGELSEGVTEDVAKAVIVAVAKGNVRHIGIAY